MKFRDLLVLASGIAAASQASALSLGNSQGNVLLGSPVDLMFPLQPDPGQTTESSCVAADVWMGDVPLQPKEFSVTPTPSGVRIRTMAAVTEPLLTIRLSAGCSHRIARSYTFFADPPGSVAASTRPIDLRALQPALSVTTSAATAQPTRPARASRPAKRAVNPQPSIATDQVAAPVPAASAVAAAVATAATQDMAAPVEAVVPAPAPQPAPAPLQDKPRLQVEPLEGLDLPASTAQAQPPAAAPAIDPVAEQTRELLYANAARIEALESQLRSLQKELRRNLTEISTLQTQLTEAREAGLPAWVQAALGLLALSLVVIAWLLHRLRQERQQAHSAWAHTVLAVENSEAETRIDTDDAPAPQGMSATHGLPQQATPRPDMPAAPAEPPAGQEPAPALATLPPARVRQENAAPAPVSILPQLGEVLTAQALFDVQEQAEFYASIGENDQAIAILQGHIAEHASSSPHAYMELLHLLYRLGRMENYEEVRKQFQQHFNVRVPHFLGFSRRGRDLWSAYPEVLARIEAQWPSDEVLDLLHDLIVRRKGMLDTEQRFDMAAFDDLLMLYNVAKTTPAASRGQLPGRVRTAPSEVPLPDLASVLDHAEGQPQAMSPEQALEHAEHDAVRHPPAHSVELGQDTLPPPPALAPGAISTGPHALEPAAVPEAIELALDAFEPEMSALQAAAEPPQPNTAAYTAAYDQDTAPAAHAGVPGASVSLQLAPDAVLLEGLSLDMDGSSTPPAPVPATAAAAPRAKTAEELALEQELLAFVMDERDLPPDANGAAGTDRL